MIYMEKVMEPFLKALYANTIQIDTDECIICKSVALMFTQEIKRDFRKWYKYRIILTNHLGEEMPRCFVPCPPFYDICNIVNLENKKCQECFEEHSLTDCIE